MGDNWDDDDDGISSKVQQIEVAEKPIGLARGRFFNGRIGNSNINGPGSRASTSTRNVSSTVKETLSKNNDDWEDAPSSVSNTWGRENNDSSQNHWNPNSPVKEKSGNNAFQNRGNFSRRGDGDSHRGSRGNNFSRSNNGGGSQRNQFRQNEDSRRSRGGYRATNDANKYESANFGKNNSEDDTGEKTFSGWGTSDDQQGGFSSNNGRDRSNGYQGGKGGRGFNDENKGNGAADWGSNQDSSGNGRGRGSRGDRGGERFHRDDKRGGFGGTYPSDSSGAKSEEKPIERYVPPHIEESDLFNGIPQGVNFRKYRDIKVNVTGNNIPKPINSFEESNLREFLLDNVKKANYEMPTPVQKYAIPAIMAERDVMACAQTGSGKTAGFLLPILHNLLNGNIEGASFKQVQEPYAVIIVPTRELALQICKEAIKFAGGSIVRISVIYGGVAVGHEVSQLKKGVHILVATVGKLLFYVEKLNLISFAKLRYLVLDEGDRMLDMGFVDDIKKIVSHPSMPPKEQRRTLMFSATFPEEIQKLASDFLEDYLFLSVGIVGGANDDVQQKFIEASQSEKQAKLMELLLENPNQSAIIFVDTKRRADFLGTVLCEDQRFRATTIHGDRLQRQREEALGDFKRGKFPLLIATSVCSRGLDINGVDHVINYYLPTDIDEYVHRIGRTGRVGNIGKSTSFFDPDNDMPLAHPLIKVLTDAKQEVPDWLIQYADGTSMSASIMGSRRGQFGGKDIRSFKTEDNWEKKPQVQQTDDLWD
ncbi:hypothetical protein CHUAL_009400 [Chamberlinius hualienensis]